MYDFPEQQESLEDNNVIVGDRDCAICFHGKSENELPDKICDNNKCMKHYHSACLSLVCNRNVYKIICLLELWDAFHKIIRRKRRYDGNGRN